ncbi:amidohydrolase family protein [Amycolatopsis thermophila]|uniref:Imidazolonepropionase-like amidohydrolase n=1 Tax=Amycolatopsis thermophila TaxID=206084 RepID=A0ABU0F025_9PSEU|nr:amidohydrolase family protein [Amycolatopsis thermophila]MDQ0380455.1 imidazolonepropionase-like amidohydrolase [Amycolatopsis thermophila]
MTHHHPAGTTAFTDARVIVGDGTTVLDDAVITVHDGLITGVTRAPAGDLGAANVVSLRGKTVMPALVNPHGHIGYMRGTVCDPAFYSRDNILDHLRRFVYHGVSTFQCLGTDWNGTEVAIRDEQRSGALADPDLATLFTAGSGLVAAPTAGQASGAPFFAVDAVHQVTDPADGRAFVRELAGQGVDAVKFWIDDRGGAAAKLSPEACREIVDEAHRHGIKAAAHIYTVEDAKTALDAGADILAHMPRSPEPDQELIDRLVDRDIAVFTSMSVQGPARTGWLDDPFVRETLPDAAIEDLRTRMRAREPEPLFDTGETFRRLQQNFATLHQAGVRLVYSPDTGVFAQLPGVAEHRELEALVEAGLSPLEAIEFATRRSSRLLGLTDRGVIEAGRRADLLVLDADPRDDITNTRRISDVVLHGRVVDRERLRRQWQAEHEDVRAR